MCCELYEEELTKDTLSQGDDRSATMLGSFLLS